MNALLVFSRAVDRLNHFIGKHVIWLILASTVISAINAVVRKALNVGSNAFLEVQWYLFAATFLWYGVPFFLKGLHTGEMSSNAGGLIRWPVYMMMPLGFTLLLLQGWSELIKRLAFLQGLIEDPTVKKVEKTPEEELAEAIRKLAESKPNAV